MLRGLLIDLDGVMYQGDVLLPGAEATARWLQREGIAHLYLTNTTSKSRAALRHKLAGLGLDVEEDAIWTPSAAAHTYLRSLPPGSLHCLLNVDTQKELAPLDSPELPLRAVIVGDLGERWTFEALNRGFNLLNQNPDAELIALGMTRYFKTEKRLQLDVGPFVAALAFASGREPRVLGKPAAEFFHQACARLGLPPADVAMVGDDAMSDVMAADAAGLKGCLVRTGKFQPTDATGIAAERQIATIGDLQQWWEQRS